MTKRKQKPQAKKKGIKAVPKKETAVAKELNFSFWKKSLIPSLLLLLLPFALYFQTIGFGYVLDDQIVITDNDFTKKGFSGISDLLTTESMTGYFGEQKNLVQGNRYRPLSLVTFAIEKGILGDLNPAVSHTLNILLYGITCVLLFWWLQLLLQEKRKIWWSVAFVASLLFLFHPIHIEAVANIKGRDEILALLLSIGTSILAFKYVHQEKLSQLVGACLMFFLALLAKENAITFLAVIPLSIYFFGNVSMGKNLKLLLALTVVTAIYLGIRFNYAGVPDFSAQSTDLMNNPFLGMRGSEKFGTILLTLMNYLKLWIFPHPLSHDYYPYAIAKTDLSNGLALLSLLLHIALLIFALLGLKKKRIVSFAILYYYATLSIVSNIVVNLGTFMNERFLFTSSVALALLTAQLLLNTKLGKNKVGLIIAGLLLVGYTVKNFDRVPDWENALTLNQSAVKYGTNSARANSFMATALYNEAKELPRGDDKAKIIKEAEAYAKKAVQIFPNYQNGNLMKAGIAAEKYGITRDEKELLQTFKEVVLRRPDIKYVQEYLDFLNDRTQDANYLKNWYLDVARTNLLENQNRPNWAYQYLTIAKGLAPNDPQIDAALRAAQQRAQ